MVNESANAVLANEDDDQIKCYRAFIKNISRDEWVMSEQDGDVEHTSDENEALVFYDPEDAENTLEYLNVPDFESSLTVAKQYQNFPRETLDPQKAGGFAGLRFASTIQIRNF